MGCGGATGGATGGGGRVLERSADLLTGGQWAAWHYVDRRAFEDPTAVVSGLTRGVERVESLAARVRAGGLD